MFPFVVVAVDSMPFEDCCPPLSDRILSVDNDVTISLSPPLLGIDNKSVRLGRWREDLGERQNEDEHVSSNKISVALIFKNTAKRRLSQLMAVALYEQVET